nr:MAG TPA: hypothetical protein [Bacteriophage sp.]
MFISILIPLLYWFSYHSLIKSLVLKIASYNLLSVENHLHLIPLSTGSLSAFKCLNIVVSFFITSIVGLLGISYLSVTISPGIKYILSFIIVIKSFC